VESREGHGRRGRHADGSENHEGPDALCSHRIAPAATRAAAEARTAGSRFFRLPLKTYQHNAGPAVGHTFLAFTHVGRKTGRPHQTVAMVLRYDKASGEAMIVSAWGPQTDWYLNLQAHPAVQVAVGRSDVHPAAAVPQ
jgi:F420H(2)-dependent quinone reductase